MNLEWQWFQLDRVCYPPLGIILEAMYILGSSIPSLETESHGWVRFSLKARLFGLTNGKAFRGTASRSLTSDGMINTRCYRL
jgi:hypothetical protein